MKSAGRVAALFDFDGVIMDTEGQYSIFWNERGKKYLNEDDFGRRIKGQTLQQIYDKHFAGMDEIQKRITGDLNRYESQMNYDYLPGVEDFLKDLRRNKVKIALVTSSNDIKMSVVYNAHPELREYFDCILTANDFTRSKPDPECFQLGMKIFETTPENTFVFEDSFHGLQAGRDSGATVIGLATTNPREAIGQKAHHIIDDFRGMTFKRMVAMATRSCTQL